MGLLKSAEIIGRLLDRGEREAVLGDIQERGADFRALVDLIGLTALRQLQAWKSWRTWLLAASMGIPAVAIWAGAKVVADTASYYPWPDLAQTGRAYFLVLIACRIISIVGLAWAAGFSIASLAKYRAIGVVVPLGLFTMWQPLGLVSLMLLIGVPSLLGLGRGWRGNSLAPTGVLVVGLLCLPVLAIPSATTWAARIFTFAAFWPAYYAAANVSLSKRPDYRSH